jgi:RimJ/RimL family protein N-acetyltransferase
MRRLVFDSPLVGRFVAERAKCGYNPDLDTTIGVVEDSEALDGSDGSGDSMNRVAGGVIFTNHTGASCWLHVAGRHERWITHDMLAATFHYPFVQLGYRRIFGLVEKANEHALSFDLRLGFRVEAVLPEMFVSGPGVVVTMARDDCRWLRLRLRTVRG